MKNLLIFANNFGPKMETFIRNHIEYMVNHWRGEVAVFCHEKKTKDFTLGEHELITSGIPHIENRVKQTLYIFFKHPLIFFKLLKYGRNTLNLSVFCMANQLVGKNFDVIHVHFGQNGNLIAALKDVGLVKTKLIVQFHGLDFSSEKCRKAGYYKILIKNNAVVTCGTAYAKKKILELGFSESLIKVIPAGSNADFFKRKTPYKLPSEKIKIIFIGRLISLKGAQLIPAISKELQKKNITDFEFVVIGDGPEKAGLEQQNDPHITLMGFQKPDFIKSQLESAHLYIYPGIKDEEGREEGQGLTIQEAMFMKLPAVASAVASNVGGVPESIKDGRTGFICEPGNITCFAEKIIQLKNNLAKAKMMGQEAYVFAKEKYSKDKNYGLFIKIYKN